MQRLVIVPTSSLQMGGWITTHKYQGKRLPLPPHIVARCSATPASVAATPPLQRDTFSGAARRATLLAVEGRQVRQGLLGGGCSAILLLHLKNPRILRKSAATRAALHVWRDRGPCTRVQLNPPNRKEASGMNDGVSTQLQLARIHCQFTG